MTALVYQGHAIRQDGEMLSLTDMWRAARSPEQKRPADWLSLPSTGQFREAVEATLVAGKSGIQTTRGGRGVGGSTFAHWQIALAYAKYLSHEFHMWCNAVVRAHMEGLRPAAAVAGIEDFAETGLRERAINARLVELMERMKGPVWAFALYRRLGLPVVEPEPADVPEIDQGVFSETVAAFAQARGRWTGTAVQLLAALNAEVGPETRRHPNWPRTGQGLGSRLIGAEIALAARGVALIRSRTKAARTLTLVAAGAA